MRRTLLAVLLVLAVSALAVVAREAPLDRSAELVWPMPTEFATTEPGDSLALDSRTFGFKLSGEASRNQVLIRAAERYLGLIFKSDAVAAVDPAPGARVLPAVEILVEDPSVPLGFGVDESFGAEFSTAGSWIRAETVWGALRGMELFSQLVQSRDGQRFVANLPIQVHSEPRFPHRGLLLDTARHYMPLAVVRRTIDALAYNAMNVLHWHIVDAESFPFDTTRSPLLVKGAYTKDSVYSKAQVAEIIEYARMRGVRVMLEIDMPGHAYSWGYGYPAVTTKCPRYEHNINNIPLNPAVDQTWTVIDGLLRDILGDVNKDQYFHIGADEVVYSCWRQDDVLMEWAARNGFTEMTQVMKYFQERLWSMIGRYNTSMMAWEEILTDYGLTDLPKDLVIHVWKDGNTLLKAANVEQPAIMSFGWYVDHLQRTWKEMYLNEPLAGAGWNDRNSKFVLGGESAAWAENINQFNLDAVVWPRTSAVAERLYSPAEVNDPVEAIVRLNHQVCRLNRRGIAAGPVRPNHCYV